MNMKEFFIESSLSCSRMAWFVYRPDLEIISHRYIYIYIYINLFLKNAIYRFFSLFVLLPTKVNLCHWRILDNPTCKACGLEVETSARVFWHSEKAQEIGQLSGF